MMTNDEIKRITVGDILIFRGHVEHVTHVIRKLNSTEIESVLLKDHPAPWPLRALQAWAQKGGLERGSLDTCLAQADAQRERLAK
jgi:hypothetical protein